MKRRSAWFGTLAAAVILAAALAGCSKYSSTSPGSGSVPDVSGAWTGTWKDTRYGVQGALTAQFTKTSSGYTATGTIDLGSLGAGVVAGTGTGTVYGDTLTFTFSAAGLGSGTGTLTASAGTGTGSVTAFGGFTFSGTVEGGVINGTFSFTSATGGRGTVALTRS